MTFEEFRSALLRMNITADAAEAHGWLCGALCVREDYGAEQWLQEIGAERAARAADHRLRALALETLAALRSPEFEFAPLLPDDDAPLAERVAALAGWSGGFLSGVGAGATGLDVAGAHEVGEYLRDLSEISQAVLERDRDPEDGERDFVELFEFVRAGAQLTYDELERARVHAPG